MLTLVRRLLGLQPGSLPKQGTILATAPFRLALNPICPKTLPPKTLSTMLKASQRDPTTLLPKSRLILQLRAGKPRSAARCFRDDTASTSLSWAATCIQQADVPRVSRYSCWLRENARCRGDGEHITETSGLQRQTLLKLRKRNAIALLCAETCGFSSFYCAL